MPNRRQIVRYRQKEGGNGTVKQRERQIQRSFVKWKRKYFPHIVVYNDWASGAYLTDGQNKARLALSCRLNEDMSDWVDIFIAEPMHGYHGFFIELKKEDVKIYLKDKKTLVANSQVRKEAAFLEYMRSKGYCVTFAIGEEDLKDKFCRYLGVDRPDVDNNPTLF